MPLVQAWGESSITQLLLSHMFDTTTLKRNLELLSERLGKAQDYL